ncbi:MAG: SDR family oxidoreductase [Gemmatimonadaceae bacterium]|nr:SDR family oxidoreductase [Gemmatimonadaceae bacterium]
MSKPIALITGASRGIGRAIALRLATGHDIVGAARSEAELQTLAAEIERGGGRCRPVMLDVTDAAAVASVLADVQADVVVNNAGVGVIKPLLDTTPEEWHRQVDVNFNAVYHVTRAVLPGMVARGRGHVVIIGSIAGRSAFAGGAAYTGTKHAVMAFAECLLLEVRDRGVKVSVVSPGGVATDFGGGDPGAKSWALRPEDVAEAVAHVLATPPNVLVHRVEVRALSKKG